MSKKRLSLGLLAVCLLAAFAAPAGAAASFGVASFDTASEAGPEGAAYTQAGGHPYAVTTHIAWNSHLDETATLQPDADLKDGIVDLPPGVVGNPTVTPKCSLAQLSEGREIWRPVGCPISSQIGTITATFNFTKGQEETTGTEVGTYPLFNMITPTGVAALFGFKVLGVPVLLDASLREDSSLRGEGGYAITVASRNVPQALRPIVSDVTIWGTPAASAHNPQRCLAAGFGFGREEGCGALTAEYGGGEFSSDAPDVPFMRMPSACTPEGVGQEWRLHTDSWEQPGVFSNASVFTHLPPYAPAAGAPGPQQGPDGCASVPFEPGFSAIPTQHSGAGASGIDVSVSLPSEGILNPEGIGQSDVKKAVVTLPEGMTVNPSLAEGVGVCTPAQYAAESAVSLEGEGCPSSSKIGTISIKTPLLEEEAEGALYLAQPDDPRTAAPGAENPFDSLLALYVVAKVPQRGVMIKLAGKVEPDPRTGQLRTTFDDLPQLPFETFHLKFREGQRAPLITPRTCGSYAATADFYPWARPEEAVRTVSTFQVTSGVGGGPCPAGGVPPFHPGFSAGTENNAAASYSPFLLHLTRQDGEQDLTKFNAVLPPGVLAKLAGVAKCPDSAVADAKAKTGIEEREHPSCPASSKIGDLVAGAGVGSTLVYASGTVYLGGPYHGDPLSVIAITPAVAGPFDVGDVVVRQALTLNPLTAEVEVDGAASDPIPHILAGIPLAVRDIQVNVDRPDFTLNPTSCDPSQVKATLFGSNVDLFSSADDDPVSLANRFQAASCASLPFRPHLALHLKGGTRRGAHPALTAIFTAGFSNEANVSLAQVRLPRSGFLDQSHIRTICTRVQFAAGGGNGEDCPKGARYGYAKAWTPLLDEPVEGPVYLRSSSHKLPDLVAALHGIVNVDVVGRIDSAHGGIRATFEHVPDAFVSRFVLRMQGAKKGLLQNSTDICAKTHRAAVHLVAHNGKVLNFHPPMRPQCGRAHKRRHHAHHQPHHGSWTQ